MLTNSDDLERLKARKVAVPAPGEAAAKSKTEQEVVRYMYIREIGRNPDEGTRR